MSGVPRWKKDETVFEVAVNTNSLRGAQTTIPKPIADLLGITDSVIFEIKDRKGKRVVVEKGEKKD